MNNSLSENSNVPENTKPIGIQREEAIVQSYRSEVDLLREIMRSTRDESVSIMNVGHHLGNALCAVSGDEAYEVIGLDEGEYLMKVLHTCNEKLLDMSIEERLPLLQDITDIAALFKTTSGNKNQFYGIHQLLEKIFDIAGIDKSLPESENSIIFFSQTERA